MSTLHDITDKGSTSFASLSCAAFHDAPIEDAVDMSMHLFILHAPPLIRDQLRHFVTGIQSQVRRIAVDMAYKFHWCSLLYVYIDSRFQARDWSWSWFWSRYNFLLGDIDELVYPSQYTSHFDEYLRKIHSLRPLQHCRKMPNIHPSSWLSRNRHS